MPTDPRRWAVQMLLVAILIDELLHGASAWRALVADAGRGTRFVNIDRIETTPLLHAAAAIIGALLGLAPALGSWRHNPQRADGASGPAAITCR